MSNFHDLPDELILKILSYSEVKELISCGQVSKRIRKISHDGTLWMTANLAKKIVKTELLEMILGKGCKVLILSNSTILGSFSSNIKSQLRVLNLSHVSVYRTMFVENKYMNLTLAKVLEELLFSCCSLQHLEMEGLCITPEMAISICKNAETLQILNLNNSLIQDCYDASNGSIQSIIRCCQQLKEIDLVYINAGEGRLSSDNLEFLAKNISPNVEKLKLSNLNVKDTHAKILFNRCNRIKILASGAHRPPTQNPSTFRCLQCPFVTEDSIAMIGHHLHAHSSYPMQMEIKII